MSLCVAFAALACGTSGARADFFSDLFGIRPQPPQPVFHYVAPLRRHVHHAIRHVRVVHHARVKAPAKAAEDKGDSRDDIREQAGKFAKIIDEKGAAAAFMADPTLRRGDIVVTEHGIQVFEGRSAYDHSRKDFRPIAQSKIAGRGQLVELERVSRLGLARVAAGPAPAMPLSVSLSAPASAPHKPSGD
jgi:hypothetical protein